MAASRIGALLAGDKEQRDAALTELAALSNGDDADMTTNMSVASIHIGGVEGELEDEARLADAFGRFGTVLAVTLRKRREVSDSKQLVSWALLTFSQEDEKQSAIEGAGQVGSVTVRPVDTQQALGSTGAMGSIMRQHHKRVDTSVAKACVEPLVALLRADASRVDGVEAQRVYMVLCGLMLLDPVAIVSEWVQRDFVSATWTTTTSTALAKVLAKDGEELARDDVLLWGCDWLPHLVYWGKGFSEITASAQADEMSVLHGYMTHCPLYPAHCDDKKSVQRIRLALDAIRDPQGLSDLQLAGIAFAVTLAMQQRSHEVVAAVVDAGTFEVGASVLGRISPVEAVTWCTPSGLLAASLWSWFANIAQTADSITSSSLVRLIVDHGLAEIAVSTLQAYELRGSRCVHEASPMLLAGILGLFTALDLSEQVAAPIVARFRGIPFTWTFLLEHPLDHMKAIGVTTATSCAMLCSGIFGKDEGGGYTFSFEMVDGTLKLFNELLVGTMSIYLPVLPPHWLVPVLHLCISDENKRLLMESPTLVPLLLSALFLEDDHARKDSAESMKAPIQAHAAECFLHLAVYEPAREVLKTDPAVIEALRLLEGRALTQEARKAAYSAATAIEGITHAAEPTAEGSHIMMSYNWGVQEMIKRVVGSLRQRQYAVWLDIDHMKGQTIDAMAEAIDDATVVLFAVSLAYKESANCRMECQYAHQADKPMIPLMVEKDYRANGWLGLILGSALWYPFFDVQEDAASFEARIDDVAKAIGDRCKSRLLSADSLSEAVPPPPPPASTSTVPHPNPSGFATHASPHPQLETSAAALSDRPSSTPTKHATSTSERHGDNSALLGGSLVELSRFIQDQQMFIQQQLEAKIETMQQQMLPKDIITAEQLTSVQHRLQKLHVAKLLSDDELFTLEDLCADVIELRSSVGSLTAEAVQTNHLVARASKLMALSENIPSDNALARQLRRKFV